MDVREPIFLDKNVKIGLYETLFTVIEVIALMQFRYMCINLA